MEPGHIERICDAFGIGSPASIEEDPNGVLNRNYDLTTDNGRYFVKSIRDRRKDSIPVIAAAESFMAEGGIPAVCMLRTGNGDLFLPHEGEMYTVYPYVPNVAPKAPPFESLGQMLARIHVRGSETLPPILADIAMTEKPSERVHAKLVGYRERALEGKSEVDAAFVAYTERKLELLPHLPEPSTGSHTLVHGDYHTRNILFDAERAIIGICDWEKAELAPRAYEVARSVQYICFEGRGDGEPIPVDESMDAAMEFLRAYRMAYSMSDLELRAGFDLRLRKLVMSFWIEERYYDHKDDRANKFVRNELRLLGLFSNPELTNTLLG